MTEPDELELLVRRVFAERAPQDVPCEKDWRRDRLIDVLRAFSGDWEAIEVIYRQTFETTKLKRPA